MIPPRPENGGEVVARLPPPDFRRLPLWCTCLSSLLVDLRRRLESLRVRYAGRNGGIRCAQADRPSRVMEQTYGRVRHGIAKRH